MVSLITSYRPDALLIKDMKIGQKYYEADFQDPLVYVLLDVFVDDQDPDKIGWVCKVFKTNDIIKKSAKGSGVRDRQHVFKYVRRDRSSYVAGFQACMKIYHEHMQVFDKQNAGLDTPMHSYNTMGTSYRNWVRNIEV
jgi:hypothetical protein